MLFTTAAFLLLFLPVALLGFYAIGRRSPPGAAAWLMLASVVFYGYWMAEFVLLLLGSITVNFTLGQRIVGRPYAPRRRTYCGLQAGAGMLGQCG